MYNLDNFKSGMENSYIALEKLIDYKLDETIVQKYDQYLKHYSFLSTYNILRLSANTLDYDARRDYERLGKLDQQLRTKFEEYKKAITDVTIQRELKHQNTETYLTQLFSMSGSNSWEKYYEFLISSLKDDKGIGLTTHISNLENSSEAIRRDSFLKIKEICAANENSFAFCLNSIKKEAKTIASLRGFDSILAMSFFDDRIQKATIDRLFSSLEENKDIFVTYLENSNKKAYYNILALEESNVSFSYDEACELVLSAFMNYNTELYEHSQKMIKNNYIDIYPRENKTTGGFCQSCNIVDESRILLNFTGTLNDVFTLAHELGHAYHFYLLKDELRIHQNYTMPLAESASNLCEIILYNHLKEQYPIVKQQRKNDLMYIFLDIYNRYLFEDEFINKRENGELSASEINEIFKKHQKNTFEVFDELNEYMWILKPHYYDAKFNYYNYPYAIGCVIANTLYEMPKEDVKKFLRLTGKKEIEELIDLDFDQFFAKIKEEF